MFIKKKDYDALITEIARLSLTAKLYEETNKRLCDRLDAELEESIKWRERCHELYNEKK